MHFFVLLITCLLDENSMPHVESHMRNATHSDDCPHDASVCSNRLPLIGWNKFVREYFLEGLQMLLNWVQMQ